MSGLNICNSGEEYSCDFKLQEKTVPAASELDDAEHSSKEYARERPLASEREKCGGCLSMILMTIGLGAGFVTAFFSMLAAV